MAFQRIIGQENAVALIERAMSHGRVPHAWLFSGMAHVGKFRTALTLAMSLNCLKMENDACGECDNCRQIENEYFPDFQVVRPEGKNIRISQVRETLDWLHLHPDCARYRVLIFDCADQMNHESANAFLKTLEEPPQRTLIILVAVSPQNLPETVISRCQHVRFKPLEIKKVKQILLEETELDQNQAEMLASYGRGCVRADLANQVELVQNVQNSVIQWIGNLSPANMEDIFHSCAEWSKSKQEEWRLLLDVLETWFRDLAWLKQQLPEHRLLYPQRLGDLEKCSRHFSIQSVYDFFRDLSEVRRSIELNANRTLALESLWIRLKHYASA